MSPRGRSWIAASTCLLLLCVFAAASAAGTLEVGSGKTYSTIQEAIDAANGGDEIVVSAGTYAECISFAGKSITVRSTDPDNPAVVASTVINGGGAGSVVTFNSGEGVSAVLMGLTITNGSGTLNSYGGFDGGGIYCSGSSPTITKNVIAGNAAQGTLAGGGGIVCHSGANALIDCNTISNNTIGGFNTYGGGIASFGSSPTISGNLIVGNAAPMLGGGIYANQTSGGIISGNTISGNTSTSYGGGVCLVGSPTLSHNLITANTASTRGAGIYINDTANPVVESNVISANTGASQGGGICSYGNSASTSIRNNLIVGNSAKSGGWGGGGIHCYSSSPTIRNNTIVSNSAAGASLGGAGILCSGGSASIENNIIAGNTDGGGIRNYQASPSVSYTNLFGNTSANYVGMTDQTGSNGNISVDPLFAGPADYHLQSRQGRWTPVGWVNDAVDSPCIDAGNPASAVGDEPTPNGGVINMGAYGGTAQASKTYTIPTPTLTELIPDWALVGSSAFTLTVVGSDFVDGAVVRWGGADRTTTFISDTQVTAAIAASDLATIGAVDVTVFNPAPGGGESNSLPFDVKGPPSVVWVDDDWTGPANCGGHIWGYDAFAVIQQGVNAVADAGTVNVAAGSYAQQVALSRPVSLLGAQAGVPPVAGGRGGIAGESRIDATGWKYNAVNVTGDDVTVDGFMFDSCHEAITCTVNRAQHENVTISNNYFIGAGNAGVSLNPNATMAGTFKNYTVSDNLFDLTGPAKGINLSANVALFIFDGLTIQDNVIKCASGYGLFCGGFPRYEVNGLACTGNTFDQCRFNIVKMNNPTITDNIFKNIASSSAIYVGSHNGGSVSDNQIIDPVPGGDATGIRLCGGGFGYWDCAGLDVSGNTITGYANGIRVAAGFAGSAEGNTIAVTGNGIVVLAEDGNTTLPGSIADNTIAGSAGADEVGILFAGITGAAAVDLGSTSFADDMDWFVRLAGQDGSEPSSVDVDATSATFSGAADDAAKEAKVWHDVDQAGVGHVEWGQGGATTTNLSVQNVSGAKGATVQLAARLTAGGAALAGQAVAISVDGAAVGSPVTDANGWARIDYTITQDAGAFDINAAFGGVLNYQAAAGTGTLTVTTPAPTSITVTMAPNPVDAGATSTATVMGDNGVDYSAAATCYIQYGAGGSWAGNVYTSAKAGTWTVTAVYGSLAATDTLTVNPGAASSVTLAPITASITTDQDQTYTVQATDNQGNSWTPVVGDITWNHDGQGAFNGMTYEPDDLDGGNVVTITATVGGVVSNAAALTVISSGGSGTPLILAWDRDTATFYLCTDAANPQAGTALAMGNNTVGSITVTVAKTGSSSTDLVATVTNAGMPGNTLRVRWYLRSGAVDKCYYYSTISGVTHTAVYSLGRTSVDGGRSQVGFFGLAHNLNADPPTAITYSVVQQ